MTLEINMVTIISFCTCIVTVGGAVKILLEAKKAFQKPLDTVNEKMIYYDQCLKNDKKRLDDVEDVLSDLTQSINMLVKSNRTIMYHMEEGNHTGEIRNELKELDDWLMEGKEYKKNE